VHAGVRGLAGATLPALEPARPRALTAEDGTQYALCPIATASGSGLVLVVARTGAPPFHRTEVFRLAQLVGAAEAVLGIGRIGREGDPAVADLVRSS
jgi:hypothetical protein